MDQVRISPFHVLKDILTFALNIHSPNRVSLVSVDLADLLSITPLRLIFHLYTRNIKFQWADSWDIYWAYSWSPVDTQWPSLSLTYKLLNNLIGLLPWNVLRSLMLPGRLWFEWPNDLFSSTTSGQTPSQSWDFDIVRPLQKEVILVQTVGCNKC